MTQPTAILFGATGGIGQAIANILCRNQINVVLVGRNEDTLKSLHQQLAQDYQNVHLEFISCDVSVAESRQNLVKNLTTLNTPIQYFIYNAGINHFSLFTDQSPELIEKMMQVNVIQPLQLIQDIIPLMLKSGPAQIISVGSTFGSIGYPGYVSYCASKFALKGATEALAREYSDTSLKFRYFSPRATDTPMNNSYVVEMNQKLGVKMDSPEVVAEELYQFLKSDKAYHQVGYPEKIFVKVNQVLPDVVSKSIHKDIGEIKSFAKKSGQLE